MVGIMFPGLQEFDLGVLPVLGGWDLDGFPGFSFSL
jgi:hypothetical protein